MHVPQQTTETCLVKAQHPREKATLYGLVERRPELEHLQLVFRPIAIRGASSQEGYIFLAEFKFDVGYDNSNGSLRFGENHFLLPQRLWGFGIGSYLLSILINWAKQHYPSATVVPLRLGKGDASLDEARDHRNRFYESLGFTLDFRDDERREGYARVNGLDDLKPRSFPKESLITLDASPALFAKELRNLFAEESTLQDRLRFAEGRILTLKAKTDRYRQASSTWRILCGAAVILALLLCRTFS